MASGTYRMKSNQIIEVENLLLLFKKCQNLTLVVEDFSREMYSLDNNSIPESVPFGKKVQLQSFLCAAAFSKMQIIYQEKWLNQLSINSFLNAFSLTLLARFNKNIDKLSNQELIFIFNFVLEKGLDYPMNTPIFNELLQKMIPLEDSCMSLSKLFLKSGLGNISLESATIDTMFKRHPSLLDTCCEVLNQKSGEYLHNSWMIKICSDNPRLYGRLCKNLMKKYPVFLPKFVESVCRCDNILPYPSHEQACALLCVMTPVIVSPLRELHYSKLINELLQLWITHSKSVVKMIYHFPCITDCLTESCSSNVSAKRLCVHLMSSNCSLI